MELKKSVLDIVILYDLYRKKGQFLASRFLFNTEDESDLSEKMSQWFKIDGMIKFRMEFSIWWRIKVY